MQRMKSNVVICVVVLMVTCSLCSQAKSDQQSLRVLWGDAVHQEEVVGDLQKALELYEDILDQSSSSERSLAASAMLRIAQVYEKLGDQKKADLHYFKLSNEFSDVADVKSFLESRQANSFFQSENLLDIPWRNGELLEYKLYGLNEKHTATVTRIKRRDKDIPGKWIANYHTVNRHDKGYNHLKSTFKEKNHEFIRLDQSNFGFSFLSMENKNDQFIFKNKAMNIEVVQSEKINGFLNLEVQDLIRRLPLKKGFSTKLRSFAAGQPGWFEYRIKVDAVDELISIGKKVYSSTKLTGVIHSNGKNIYTEEIWLENSDARVPIKIATSAYYGELSAVDNYYQENHNYISRDGALSMSLPQGWRAYDIDMGNDESQRRLLMKLDGQSSAYIGWGKDNEIDWENIDMTVKSDSSIRWAKGFYTDFKVLEDSIAENTLNDANSIRYSGSYNGGLFRITEDRMWLASKPDYYNIVFSHHENAPLKLKDDINHIFQSIKIITKK